MKFILVASFLIVSCAQLDKALTGRDSEAEKAWAQISEEYESILSTNLNDNQLIGSVNKILRLSREVSNSDRCYDFEGKPTEVHRCEAFSTAKELLPQFNKRVTAIRSLQKQSEECVKNYKVTFIREKSEELYDRCVSYNTKIQELSNSFRKAYEPIFWPHSVKTTKFQNDYADLRASLEKSTTDEVWEIRTTIEAKLVSGKPQNPECIKLEKELDEIRNSYKKNADRADDLDYEKVTFSDIKSIRGRDMNISIKYKKTYQRFLEKCIE